MKLLKNECESEFDSDSLIAWILEHNGRIKKQTEWLDRPSSLKDPELIKLINGDLLHLNRNEIIAAMSQFPEKARKRSILANIQGMPAAWIKKGSTVGRQILCHVEKYAASPMAFVAGATDRIIQFNHHQSQDILLFRIPHVSQDIAKYVQLHAFIREYAHTMVSPLEYNPYEEYVLNVSQDYHAEALVFLSQFAKTVSKYSPISHASKLYWPLPGASDPTFCQYVGKELCESVTAHLLGFVFCLEKERWWNPFRGRRKVKELVEHFLEASKMPKMRN